MKNTVLVLLLVTLLSSCDLFDTGKKFYIDNPSGKPLKVVLDGNTTINLSPLEYKKIKITSGSHQIVVDNGNAESFTIDEKESQKGGLINPLGIKYVLWTAVYSADAKNYLPTQVISWNGKEIKGPFLVYNAIYIPDAWMYDVTTPFPENVSVNNNTNNVSSVWRTKLFRADDFTREYEQTEQRRDKELLDKLNSMSKDVQAK
ncbi:hypothetical protein H7F33_08490 [Pedobacter sp. PAMC26386]|nr:hypothetical protein H7F33_08490 [Pedobacter sp. PAMC26386]